jgi:hypothetical protein
VDERRARIRFVDTFSGFDRQRWIVSVPTVAA